jgi:hypothetical protein
MTKTKYFGRVKGGMTLHCEDAESDAVRFILCRHGEDPVKAIAAFWKEYEGIASFEIIPIFSHGSVPRAALCTQQSLTSALASVTLEANSIIEAKWRKLAEEFNVAWPKRLSRLNKPETEHKAINQPALDSA